jgi:hypothetical protein
VEVQPILHPEIRSHVLGKPGRNNNQLAMRPTLNLWPRTYRFEQIPSCLSSAKSDAYKVHALVRILFAQPRSSVSRLIFPGL